MPNRNSSPPYRWSLSRHALEDEDFFRKYVKSKDFYVEVLSDWKKGDYSNSVDVHNKIWNWQGGNVGAATRLLTAEEENKFIADNFR